MIQSEKLAPRKRSVKEIQSNATANNVQVLALAATALVNPVTEGAPCTNQCTLCNTSAIMLMFIESQVQSWRREFFFHGVNFFTPRQKNSRSWIWPMVNALLVATTRQTPAATNQKVPRCLLIRLFWKFLLDPHQMLYYLYLRSWPGVLSNQYLPPK